MKRLLDTVLAVVLLVVLSPLLLVIAVLVWFDLGRPILFRQRRVGHRGREFTIIKYRTMRVGADSAGLGVTDAERLTRLGRLLRNTSLDELPELLNVVRGEMSLVGPRPLLPEYLPRYSKRQSMRHDVRPGLTGWAQVKGRNALDWETKLELDAWYVENRSLLLDAKILLLTIGQVVMCRGVSHAEHATMPEFRGPG